MEASSRFESVMAVNSRPPVVMVLGQGSWLEDETGKRYLDFVQGWAVNCLGHAPRVIADAVEKQAGKLVNSSPAFYTAPLLELADLIAQGRALNRVFFTNCGAEANEGALKLMRKWGQKYRRGAYEIITMKNAFHGRTLATMSASDKPGWETLFEPKVSGFIKVDMNDLAQVEASITDRTVGVMLELVQGEGGVNLASESYVRDLRRLTEERGLLLAIDEVQTGMGRTGRLFAYEHFDMVPDIVTMGKGIAGGAPLGALVARAPVCCFDPGDQGGTFNGNALITAVGAAVFRAVSHPSFLNNVRVLGDYLTERLRRLGQKHGAREVRGRGLLVALVMGEPVAPDVVARAFEAGLILNAPRPNILRFMPALNVTMAEIDQMVEMLDVLLS